MPFMQNTVKQLLDYASFASFIRDKIEERMGTGYKVKICKVMKNNSLELDSLVILKEGRNFAPNIYLNAYYESYIAGTSLEDIVIRLCMIYKHCAIPLVQEDFEYSLEAMEPYIFFRLVSLERNKKVLKQLPYIEFLDLAITFHCLVRNEDNCIGTIRINNEHIKQWGITLEDLKKVAFNNTRRLFPPVLKTMKEVLAEYTYSDNIDYKDAYPMYILTNEKGINGASCMLYRDVIRDFAHYINSDLYILPSSIHEVILIPMNYAPDKEYFSRMVVDINSSSVPEDEVLSDNVYFYSIERDLITM